MTFTEYLAKNNDLSIEEAQSWVAAVEAIGPDVTAALEVWTRYQRELAAAAAINAPSGKLFSYHRGSHDAHATMCQSLNTWLNGIVESWTKYQALITQSAQGDEQ